MPRPRIWQNDADRCRDYRRRRAAELRRLRRLAARVAAKDEAIAGNIGPDLLRGLGGDDQLQGRGSDDTLVGGKGADSLTGGGGKDVFQFDIAAESGKAGKAAGSRERAAPRPDSTSRLPTPHPQYEPAVRAASPAAIGLSSR